MTATADAVEIVEVSPRDGLQNEDVLLSTPTKLELIERLVAAGVRRLEATSFVHPDRVPAMADAEAVMEGVEHHSGVSYVGLVLNERGLDRAVAAGCDEISVAVFATDSFSTRNQGVDVDEAIEVWRRIGGRAQDAGVGADLVISAAFGCPYEGEVEVTRLVDVVTRCLAVAPGRLVLGDTIGVASPRDVRDRLRAVRGVTDVPLGVHLHDTRGTGLANAYAALEVGVRSFDASVGGIGGCPFAPAATGNIATEDLVYMLDRMGFETGLDLNALAETANWLRTYLGESVVGRYSRAGPFPVSR
jgi:hydroxymethylglutaryl-CoA lyase